MLKFLNFTDAEKNIFDALLNGVYIVDCERRILYWNGAAHEISGYRSEDVLGKSCRDDVLVHAVGAEIVCDINCPLLGTMETSERVTSFMKLRHKNGYRVPVRIRCVPIHDESGAVIGAMEIFEREFAEHGVAEQLEFLEQIAYIDALTGIPNRRYAEESLLDFWEAYEKKNRSFSIAIGDIDFFKRVNDTYGHDAGDSTLKAVGRVLRSNLHSRDAVTRWGGEEFMLIMQDIDPKVLSARLEFLRHEISMCRVEIDNARIGVTMSFGCAIPKTGDSLESLIGRADANLYKSKSLGRNCVTVECANNPS